MAVHKKTGGDVGDNFLNYALIPLKKYADFSGRARRKEYWFFCLLALVVAAVAQFISPALYVISCLALFVPGAAVSVRRLQDLDKSGWWLLLYFVPIIGVLVLLVWFCSEGTSGDNQFGSDSKES